MTYMSKAKRNVRMLGAALAAVSIFFGPLGMATASARTTQPGALTVRAEVVGERAGSIDYGNLWYSVSGAQAGARGRFFDGYRELYSWPAGEYRVSGEAPAGWRVSFGGDCDADGTVSIVEGGDATCVFSYYSEEDIAGEEFVGGAGPESILIVQKKVVGEEREDGVLTPYAEFSFALDGEEHSFWEAGMNSYEIQPGEHAIAEVPVAGYVTSYGGDCDENGAVSVPRSRVLTCTITNTLAQGARPVPSRSLPPPAPTVAPQIPAPVPVVGEEGMVVSSDSLALEQTAAIGPLVGIAPCGPGFAGVLFVDFLLAALIVFFWSRRSRASFWQAGLLLTLLVVLVLAWAGACGLGKAWAAVIVSVLAWLMLWLIERK